MFWQLMKLSDVLNAVQDAILPEPGQKQDIAAIKEAAAAREPADSTFRMTLSSWWIEHAPPHVWTNPAFTALNGTFREAYKALCLSYLAFLGTTRYRRQVESDGKLEEVEVCFGSAAEWYNAAADVAHQIIATGHSGDESQLDEYRMLSLRGTELNRKFHDYLDGLAPH